MIFERLVLAAIVLGLINVVMTWGSAVAELALRPGFERSAPAILAATVLLSTLVYLAIWYFAARRASRVAKWVFVGLTLVNVGSLAWQLGSGDSTLDGGSILPMIELSLMVAAAVLLFHPDSRAWFAATGRAAESAVSDPPGQPVSPPES